MVLSFLIVDNKIINIFYDLIEFKCCDLQENNFRNIFLILSKAAIIIYNYSNL